MSKTRQNLGLLFLLQLSQQITDILSHQSDRKKDHIDLAIASKTLAHEKDNRFNYEPLFAVHPSEQQDILSFFINKQFGAPIWVSSMTGGTGIAKNINQNLARACKEYQLGMGLGSCRKILFSDEYLSDFAMRPIIGDQPLYANLGIAQINELIANKQIHVISDLINKLEADGLIVHINPVQEWLQPEGDIIECYTPLQTIQELIDKLDISIIVKEVGQGFGPQSLEELMKLPITAIEFGAFGGTNFAKLENLRDPKTDIIDPICFVGHDCSEMISLINDKMLNANGQYQCTNFIISGGVRDYLDGFYYNSLLKSNSVYGQAAGFLKHAHQNYDQLAHYVEQQISGYKFAMRYLIPKSR